MKNPKKGFSRNNPKMVLSPGCRAVELSRLRRAAVEATRTQDIIIYVTTLPHRGRVGPPPPKGVATTSNTRHNKGNETSQSPNPPPVGKAGFEAWVLTNPM